MNDSDRELARIYFDHHAEETDRRAQQRLTHLMRHALAHDATCDTEGCPVSLRSFIAGDVVCQTAINDTFLDMDLPEDDRLRQQKLNQNTVLRIFFPRAGKAFNGVLVETDAESVSRVR
jgi:hypothetical protein